MQGTTDYAYLSKEDKMGASIKNISTVYDNETNTHWEIGEGQTVDDIRDVINCFKKEQNRRKTLTVTKKARSGQLIKEASLSLARDTVNKAADEVRSRIG